MITKPPAYEGDKPFIFVSYSHKDSYWVLPIIQSLFERKYRVWYDEGIPPGSEWPKNVEEHLRAAAAVLFFVSEESIASPNCENEVANAKPGERPVYQYILSKVTHPSLASCSSIKDFSALLPLLDESLIGDGVTGYDHSKVSVNNGNFWTWVIAVAVLLIGALGVGVYGLNDGWFDSMLPGLQVEEPVIEAPEQIVEIPDLFKEGITMQTQEELMQEIEFTSGEAKNAFCNAIGYGLNNGDEASGDTNGDSSQDENTPEKNEQPLLTYFYINNFGAEDLWLEYANDETLRLLPYFPQLKCVRIRSGEMTDLSPLYGCGELETVYLAYDAFPVEIPENAPFTVEFMG